MVMNDTNPQIDVIVIDNATFPFTSLVAQFDITAEGKINNKNTPS